MKIVYIGASDGLAETLAERMGQEGDDVYLLSDKAPPCTAFTAVPARGRTLESSCAPSCRTASYLPEMTT